MIEEPVNLVEQNLILLTVMSLMTSQVRTKLKYQQIRHVFTSVTDGRQTNMNNLTYSQM